MKGDLSHNILTDTYINWLSNSIMYIWLSNVMCNINWAKISALFCFCFRFLISPKYISQGVLCWKSSIMQHIYIHFNVTAKTDFVQCPMVFHTLYCINFYRSLYYHIFYYDLLYCTLCYQKIPCNIGLLTPTIHGDKSGLRFWILCLSVCLFSVCLFS